MMRSIEVCACNIFVYIDLALVTQTTWHMLILSNRRKLMCLMDDMPDGSNLPHGLIQVIWSMHLSRSAHLSNMWYGTSFIMSSGV